MTSLHITTKDLPNWFWATFEHEDNPGLEAVVPSKDEYGLPNSLKGTKWENYVLRGSQVDFVDSFGQKTILANSQIERGFQRSSSCITCHARATIGERPRKRQGESLGINRLSVFEGDDGSVGSPEPSWFVDTDRVPAAQEYVQMDFVWSLFRAQRRDPGESTEEKEVRMLLPAPQEATTPARMVGQPTTEQQLMQKFGDEGARLLQSKEEKVSGIRFEGKPVAGWREFIKRERDPSIPSLMSPDKGILRVPTDLPDTLLESYQNASQLLPIEAYFFGIPETVCWPDERVQVPDTTDMPWSANCQLIITMSGGQQAIGTGWLAGPKLVVTAGHCVHEGAGGNYFERVEVIPGMNGPLRPFGAQVSSTLRASLGWTTNGSAALDYGAIILDAEFQTLSGKKPGKHSIVVKSDQELQGELVMLSGYPGDKVFGSQWTDADPLSQTQSQRLKYLLDTAGGQSGSAVIPLGEDAAVGIHNYGGCPNNCTRITQKVKADIDTWLNESGGP